MEKVGEEWRKSWKKVQINYNYPQEIQNAILLCPDFFALITKYVKKRGLILEAGCGYGIKCLCFNRIYNASCIGIDIVVEPLKTLTSYLNVTNHDTAPLASDVTYIPFKDDIFDVVTSFGVIEHFRKKSEILQFLNDVSRVLKKDGFLILTIPNFASTFRNKLYLALSKRRFGIYHKPYTMSSLASIFNSSPLKPVEIGFISFGFHQLALKVRFNDKLVYFLYHAVWKILCLFTQVLHENYLDPIYVIAKKAGT